MNTNKNILIYIPTQISNYDFGFFIQHHADDEETIQLDYYNFDKVISRDETLNILTNRIITQQMREDTLVDGFKLDKLINVDLKNEYNRHIKAVNVKQIFVFLRVKSENESNALLKISGQEYCAKHNVIFANLWTDSKFSNKMKESITINDKTQKAELKNLKIALENRFQKAWTAYLASKREQNTPKPKITTAKPTKIPIPKPTNLTMPKSPIPNPKSSYPKPPVSNPKIELPKTQVSKPELKPQAPKPHIFEPKPPVLVPDTPIVVPESDESFWGGVAFITLLAGIVMFILKFVLNII